MTSENYQPSRKQSSSNLTSITVVLSSFLVYVINGGVFFSSGIFYPEFLESGVGGKVAISWLASLQTSVCLFSGKYLRDIIKAPSINAQCQSMPIKIMVLTRNASQSALIGIDQHWDQSLGILIGIWHWSICNMISFGPLTWILFSIYLLQSDFPYESAHEPALWGVMTNSSVAVSCGYDT